MWLQDQHYVGAYANEYWGSMCIVCLCVPAGACLHLCVYKSLHITQFSAPATARQVWGPARARGQILEHGPRWANIALPPNICLPPSLIQRLSLSCILCSLSFPLCRTQRTSLLFRVGNATGAKSALVFLFDIIPPLFLPSPIAMCLASDGIANTHGNKQSLDKIYPVMSGMCDFKYGSGWHLSLWRDKGQMDVFTHMLVWKGLFKSGCIIQG